MSYPIIQLAKDAPTQLEQLGTKNKFWYRNQNEQSMLFKEGRPGTGENWAEKVGCELCRLLDIPHAHYDLAVWEDRKGVVSPSFVPEGGRLVLGNELLAKIIDDYEEEGRYQVRQHTVRTAMAVMSSRNVGMPLAWAAPAELKDAASVFVAYFLLDALVSNQDRHHENWGLIMLPEQGVSLAPTFDHASSLGRNETDKNRRERLISNDKGRKVEAYVARAISPFFATPSSLIPLRTIEAFREAAKIRPDAADYWVRKLAKVNLGDYKSILAEIPDSAISGVAREFACEMLKVNSARIQNS